MLFMNLIVGIIMALVTMCSILGNSLVFIVVCWNHSLKKPLNLFLFNLAIADIGISCTCIPYAVGQVVFRTNDLDMTLCYVNTIIAALFVGASAGIIMALSLYQYLFVSGPLDSSLSTLQSCSFIIFAWVLALALSLAPYFGLGDYEFSLSIFECVFPNRSGYAQRLVYDGLLMGVWYIMPVITLIICYILVLVHLRDTEKMTAKGCIIASVANDDGCLETGQGRTTRTMIFICLVFILFRTPLFVSIVLSTWSLVESSWLALIDQIAFWAIYCHAASDPFVYALQQGEFTHTIRVIWKTLKERFIDCCCCCFAGNVEEGEKIAASLETKKTSLKSIKEED